MFNDELVVLIGLVNLHAIGWSEYLGAIISRQHESPAPVLWSVNFMY